MSWRTCEYWCVCVNMQCSCVCACVLFAHLFIHFICICVAIALRTHYMFAFSCKCFLYAYVCVCINDWYFCRCVCVYVMSNWMWLASSTWFANCNLTFTFLRLFTLFIPNKALPLFSSSFNFVFEFWFHLMRPIETTHKIMSDKNHHFSIDVCCFIIINSYIIGKFLFAW